MHDTPWNGRSRFCVVPFDVWSHPAVGVAVFVKYRFWLVELPSCVVLSSASRTPGNLRESLFDLEVAHTYVGGVVRTSVFRIVLKCDIELLMLGTQKFLKICCTPSVWDEPLVTCFLGAGFPPGKRVFPLASAAGRPHVPWRSGSHRPARTLFSRRRIRSADKRLCPGSCRTKLCPVVSLVEVQVVFEIRAAPWSIGFEVHTRDCPVAKPIIRRDRVLRAPACVSRR